MFLIKSFLNIESYQHYTHCVDAFIEQAVQQLVEQGMNDDIFSQVEGIYRMWFGPLGRVVGFSHPRAYSNVNYIEKLQ